MARGTHKLEARRIQAPKSRSGQAAPAHRELRDRTTLYQLLILGAVCIALYAQTLWNGFVVDDNSELLENQAIRHLSNIPSFFAHGVWFSYGAKVDRYYRPLKFIFYSLEYHLFHLHPAPWHLVNILLHIAVVFGIYFLVRDMASRQLGFWSALIFAFQPLHVETVAWVSAGSDLQCTAALLFSIWLYHRARRQERPIRLYAGSIALFAVGLLAKEVALTFPGVVLAYDYLYRGESVGEIARGWRRYVAYAGVLGFYFLVRLQTLHGFAPMTNSHRGTQLTPEVAVLSIAVLIARYLEKSIVPTNLNFWYTYRLTPGLSWGAAGALVLLAAMVAGMFWLRAGPAGAATGEAAEKGPASAGARRRQPMLAFALAWFFFTLAPALDLWKVSQLFAERYYYAASFAFCVFAAWGWLWFRDHAARAATGLEMRRVAASLSYAALAALIGFYSFVAVRRMPYWHDDFRFWVKTVEQAPNESSVNGEVGFLYLQKGEYQQSVAYTKKALALDPGQAYFHTNLASGYLGLGRYNEAVGEAQKAIALQPNVAPLWLNLATVYRSGNQWAQAAEACEKGLESEKSESVTVMNLTSHDHELLTLLALAQWHLGQQDQAIETYRRAIAAEPETLDAYIDLANAYAQLHRLPDAMTELETALHANPNSPDLYIIHFELGVIYEAQSQWRPAALEYQESLQLNPNFTLARTRLQPLAPFLTNPNLSHLPSAPPSP